MSGFNHLVKVADFIKNLKDTEGFHIKVLEGSYSTKRFDGTYNLYNRQYKLYVNEQYIKYGKFYQPYKIASLVGISIQELESFYEINLDIKNNNVISQELHDIEVSKELLSISDNKLKQLALNPNKLVVSKSTVVVRRARNQYLAKYIKNLADGRCELCEELSPIVRNDNTRYLEIHHIERLSDGGDDLPNNVVALCPNCHMKMHYGSTESKTSNIKLLKERILLRNKNNNIE